MRNKLDELEVLAQSHSYDTTGISETWWDESCDQMILKVFSNLNDF